MEIKKIQILIRKNCTDVVFVHTGFPTPFPHFTDENMMMKFEVQRGNGINYVRENFKIEPEIINGD